MLGSALCGLSILIENERRQSEMALYVAPRALYTVIPDVLPGCVFNGPKGEVIGKWTERCVSLLPSLSYGYASSVYSRHARAFRALFSLSAGAVTTATVHRPQLVRGVIRAIMDFVVRDWKNEGRGELDPRKGGEEEGD
jgi:hypothetical protein